MNKLVFYIVAIAVIALIEITALIKGINGSLMAIAIGAIGTIAGFVAGKKN